jgi:hypothetical protein
MATAACDSLCPNDSPAGVVWLVQGVEDAPRRLVDLADLAAHEADRL